jgi:hypothetical protein
MEFSAVVNLKHEPESIGFVSGHGFSRAANSREMTWALAPESWLIQLTHYSVFVWVFRAR